MITRKYQLGDHIITNNHFIPSEYYDCLAVIIAISDKDISNPYTIKLIKYPKEYKANDKELDPVDSKNRVNKTMSNTKIIKLP